MKNWFLAGLIALAFPAFSQVLDEDTKILDKVGGEATFSLNKGEKVYSFEPEEGWYKIRKTAYVNVDDLVDEKYLAEGTGLKDKSNNKIGEVISEVKVKDMRLIEGFRNNDRYVITLEGYIYKTKIEKNSIPEDRVNDLLTLKNRTQQFEGFEELFDLYGFEERKFGEFTAYAFRDNNRTAGEENDFRMILVFRGETSVYAIITNDHEVSPPKVKDQFEDGSFKIFYLYKPSVSYKDLIENKILYTFVAL